MLILLLLIALGLALLVTGGKTLVNGASALAADLGVSPLVIGLTVVAFGTGAPELSVNILASVQGNSAISFGNIIGSNIANIGLVLGVSALVRPLAIKGIIIIREIPMMLLASAAALIAGLDVLLRGSEALFDRSEGLLFLLLFCVFLFYTVGDVIRKRKQDPLILQVEEFQETKSLGKSFYNFLLVVFGLLLLIGGGKVVVDAAVALAALLDVPRIVIGFTIIAVGTSLPELTTSLIATWHGQTDIAIGNVIGSNIFNLLLVNGICATIRPIPIPAAGGIADLLLMVLLSLVVLPLCMSNKNRIVRWEGSLLLIAYLGYVSWRLISA